MKKYFILVLLVGIGGGLWGLDSPLAETAVSSASKTEDSEFSTVLWQRMIDEIKKEASSLLEENQRLTKERLSLEKEIAGLKSQVAAQEKERDSRQPLSETADSLRALQEEIEALEEKNNVLETKSLVLEKANRLRELQIEELKLNLEESALEAPQQESSVPVQDSTSADPDLGNTDQLKKEIDDWQSRLSFLQEKKTEQHKKIKALRADYQRLLKTAQEKYALKRKEKEALSHKVLNLKSQINQLRASINQVGHLQEKRRGLLKTIVALEERNQDLHKQISDLRDDTQNER